jgi:hypothetical protein
MAMYTDRQIQKAKNALQVYYALGTPSLKDFKSIITSNQVRNMPGTLEDIKIAENIYGQDIGDAICTVLPIGICTWYCKVH